MITDTRMGNGCSKEIRLGLKILGHKSAIAGSDTSYLLPVHKTMFITESLGAGYDIFSHSLTSRIYVAGRELLSETGGSTWIDHQHHIAHGCIDMMRIAALEHTTRRTATSIIVDYHRIFLGCIKMRRQIIAAADGVALCVDIIPRLAFAQLDIFQFAGTEVVYHLCFLRLGIHPIEAVGIGCTLS